MTLYDLTVEKDHNFSVTKHGIHAHNMSAPVYEVIVQLIKNAEKFAEGAEIARAIAGGLGLYLMFEYITGNDKQRSNISPTSNPKYPPFGAQEKYEYEKILRTKGANEALAYIVNFFPINNIPPFVKPPTPDEYRADTPPDQKSSIQQTVQPTAQSQNNTNSTTALPTTTSTPATDAITAPIPEKSSNNQEQVYPKKTTQQTAQHRFRT
jgi:hypothetical protein